MYLRNIFILSRILDNIIQLGCGKSGIKYIIADQFPVSFPEGLAAASFMEFPVQDLVLFLTGYNATPEMAETWLRDNGYLAIKDSAKKKEETSIFDVDWSQTLAYGIHGPRQLITLLLD